MTDTQRKPPPNPWPRLREAEAEVARLNTVIDGSRTEMDKLVRSNNVMASRELLYRNIIGAQRALIEGLRKRRLFSRGDKIANDIRQRTVADFEQRLFDFDVKNAPPVKGHIAGLASDSRSALSRG